MIKQKVGECTDCGNMGGIIAKRCQTCYWRHRASVSKEKSSESPKSDQDKEAKRQLGLWFAEQIKQAPKFCEECGTNLTGWKAYMPTAIIAHILPKRRNGGFPEVATNPNNRMFFCPDCHTNFDRKGSDYVKKMKSLPVIKERLSLFMEELTPADQNRIPDYIKPCRE